MHKKNVIVRELTRDESVNEEDKMDVYFTYLKSKINMKTENLAKGSTKMEEIFTNILSWIDPCKCSLLDQDHHEENWKFREEINT